MFRVLSCILFLFLGACSSMGFYQTVDYVDKDRFMGKWYVIAARATFLEKGAHNSLEVYSWNKEKERIEIDFTFRKNGFDGKLKKIPQKAWIHNEKTNAHWKVQPFWPIKLDYLVLDLDSNYEWVVIGVPNEKYVWIMARDWKMDDQKYELILSRLNELNYNTKDIKKVPQLWPSS